MELLLVGDNPDIFQQDLSIFVEFQRKGCEVYDVSKQYVQCHRVRYEENETNKHVCSIDYFVMEVDSAAVLKEVPKYYRVDDEYLKKERFSGS